MFVHHVFFWLKDGLETQDIQKFEQGVSTLPPIEHVHFGEVGKPAKTNRPVIERSYSYSLLLVFNNETEHDNYQIHPVHKAFVDNCSELWSKVVIYDSETV